MPRNVLALVISYVYVVLVVGIATALRSRGTFTPETTRKIVHVGVGTWIIPTTILFTNPWLAMIPPASFIIVNLLSYRFRVIGAMEEGDRNPGTIYFPLAFVLMILLFWPGALSARFWPGAGPQAAGEIPPGGLDPTFPFSRFAVAAGIMAMAWGDAAASGFGRRFGRTRYPVPGGGRKSFEGTAAFIVFALPAIMIAAIALLMVPGPGAMPPGLSLGEALAVAARFRIVPIVIAVLAGAVVEALTPYGLDNLTVPLVVGVVARFLILK